ncbi:DinB family protein [Desulfosporosinus sp. BICA1-9]|uniref:DinB family protein n=1 Tax=Desulfosporosinus sp. BICA1-9 TaxID=1531958 RepID=UPI00054BBCC5|nr:DinB family protein [Desulfosporosinus sp. BICA1-9]KJS48027.1 MAG: metal-dependent hydrolase [Peptococcaceae bacterium BRH_c23]KJS82041.1 MAG: metal-dependent hydrolase [Desulfosporosinus sp. BICA1-9]HBW35355.1 metal-dependent hydrolase [Desulfosporosinus sp.]
MREIIERLNYLIQAVPKRVQQFSEQEFSAQLVSKWSKKEILGHLCDSATNNYHRFIKIQFDRQPFIVVPYNQNNWVLIQDYQGIPTDEIVDFWTTLNRHIVRVITKIPEEKLLYLCDIGDNKSITLSELVLDYLRHIDHHLRQIFGTSDV